MLFIQYPKCSTCKKALKYLKDNNIDVQDRNITEEIPTEKELKEWIEKSGLEFKKFFNTCGNVYKEMKLKDKIKDMSLDEAVSLLSTNGMLIKRPIVVSEDKVLVGFKEDDYAQIIK